MNVVLPSDETHTILIIPRYYPASSVVLSLFNEAKQTDFTVSNIYALTNGKMNVTFDFEFLENDKFKVKITDSEGVVYRGKLIATSQEPEQYKLTNNLYYS